MAKGNTIFQLVTCLTHSFPKHYQIQLWGYTNPYLVHMRVSYCKHKNTYHSCVHELPHTVPSPARTSVHMNYDCGLSYSQVGSNVAKLGHTGACTPATRDCAPPLQVRLSSINADCTVVNSTQIGQLKSIKSLENEHNSVVICIETEVISQQCNSDGDVEKIVDHLELASGLT